MAHFLLSNKTGSPFFYNTLVSAFHLVIQEGAVDECECLLWNLHKHIEHRGSTFLRQSDSFRESFEVQPARMTCPVIHIAFLKIWRKSVHQSQVAATLDMDAGIDKIVCRSQEILAISVFILPVF